MKRALDSLKATNAWTLDQQASICEVPAPPFKEQARGQELKRRFEQLGLRSVRVDAEGNVIGERPGTAQDGPTVVLSGHLDTVFPEGTDVKVKRETAPDGAPRLTAPGIGDDCRGLAVLLSVARAFQQNNVRTPGTILFVGTVGEEGEGNLRGVRRLFDETLKNQVDYFISVDGTGFGVTHKAVGSNRYKITFKGPGGHSYGAFGMPNPAHALGRAVAKIADLQTPADPRTTFSVSLLRGGQSVNSIPAEVSMDIDMRSEDAASLADLDKRMRAAVDAAVAEEKARWPRSTAALAATYDTIGIRPAGSQRDDAPIVRAALGAARALGETSDLSASSTDSNVPIGMGIPAVTIDGGGRGRGAHSLAESYDDTPKGYVGPQWAAVLVAALAGAK
ncbi:M20/M25/M40 family metallo-hydrolase [Roseisolibacter sp. H3M3-2]|uniref:M20/M25/M40 family metallo-hydrolase n=1 Tax=Roseisolibacter sp. H3M3-2 TaxID=3031323 RepID=UPI0023DADBFB|nr:M20/M25/M40 family metallo-hydrolase [Roseisolibacter sp. H3M3-2]MDF1503965.1 M20/M25/M40 family metallo-hydrolase [Roseisolibacter sp. H3M3-2]